jgi:UDP-sugar pyrophosphorylase
MNSLCVPRFAKEAIGGMCRLQQPNGKAMTISVEYNQLDALLRNSGYPDGEHLPLCACCHCTQESSPAYQA